METVCHRLTETVCHRLTETVCHRLTETVCAKPDGKPCYGSPKVCQLTKTSSCCWHEDKRKNKAVLYIDGYGDVDVDTSSYLVDIPVDIYYCPSCKKSETTIGSILEILKERMEPPEEYAKKITMIRTAHKRYIKKFR
jgi:hypothetical protein